MSYFNKTLKKIASLNDRRLAIISRMAMLDGIGLNKFSQDQHGMFQHFQGGVVEYDTREHYTTERGGKPEDRDKLYGIGPEHEDSKPKVREPAKSLSTRYSPDRPGVQAKRVSDGVFQDPYTNKVYDWQSGFTTETGDKYPAGGVSLQTDLD